MILETDRLILRPWEESDAEECYKYAKDPQVGPAAGWPVHTSVENSRQVIKDILMAPETYAIVLKETGLPIGSIGFHHNDLAPGEDEAELGYWLGVPFWGRGLVPEAAKEMLRYAFEDLDLERVWCGYYEGNEKSKRVQEKLGFKHQRVSENIPVPQLGETRTGHVNLLTKEDWKKAEFLYDLDSYIRDHYVEEPEKEECFDAPASPEGPFMGAAMMAQSVARDEFVGSFANAFMAERRAPRAKAGKAKSLDDVVKDLDKTFMELVFSFADEKGLTDVEVQKRANLDRKAFSKLKCGTTKNPSKSTALALAIALELNLDETKDLLSRAGLALSPCSKQDVIVQFFIEREVYDIYEINVALFEHGEQPLGTQTA